MADFDNLDRIARIASMATAVDGKALVEELRTRIEEECDYAHEATWQRRFREWFAADPEIIVPEVIADRSSDRVLTTEWCEGRDLYAFAETADAETRRRAARVLLRFTWRSLLAHRTIQADPHPGNVLFPVSGQVVFLDFGCVRAFPEDFWTTQLEVMRVVVEGRRHDFRQAVLATGMVPRPHRFDFDSWWDFCSWQYRPYCEPHFRFTSAYMQEVRRFNGTRDPNMRHVALPPPWIWLMRLLVGLHSVVTRLGAEGDFRDLVELRG